MFLWRPDRCVSHFCTSSVGWVFTGRMLREVSVGFIYFCMIVVRMYRIQILERQDWLFFLYFQNHPPGYVLECRINLRWRTVEKTFLVKLKLEFGSARQFSVGNYMFRLNNRNTRTRFDVCSELTIKTSERRERSCWRCSVVFIVNFEHILHLILVILLLTLSR